MEGNIETLAEEWAQNANEALQLALVDGNDVELNFSPAFTYPIYGDSEVIYGYRDLAISLKFDALSLLPYLSTSWTEKIPLDSIPDPKTVLLDFLPESTVQDLTLWNKLRKSTPEFEIPGEKVGSFKDKDGAEYTVYKSTFANIAAKELHERIQIFILLFIEAGSYIDATDDRWVLYTLYQTSSPHEENFRPIFAGFSTVYNYFWYVDAESYDKPNGTDPYEPYVRKRISQFVILPLFQGKRVGGNFYSTLFSTFYADPLIKEISVEDPSEAFDDLRDRNDLTRLVESGTAAIIYTTFSATKVLPEVISDTGKNSFTLEWVKDKRCENKMSVRQFDRCIEMILLYYLENKQDVSQETIRLYRLLVKRRLYLRNRDALDDMSPQDRKSKLQETFEALKDDYRRLTSKIVFPIAKRKPTDLKGKGIKKQRV
ncbi:uncharacterized protein SAPINGB_P005798 [Magnusiomyces paraingens]|uniref:Histone acetyltransferase type B catalytic subunit n=1 Tax=Magnusiomyces paraingens TaxID=2606893 RepID=A0A5E8C1N5_9ASCO|nr:uncharacterized protein SAPINGB_P005798 [Saprochaete ingens]VVT57644.1 unnamed protein product [Saprochaete ingens]